MWKSGTAVLQNEHVRVANDSRNSLLGFAFQDVFTTSFFVNCNLFKLVAFRECKNN